MPDRPVSRYEGLADWYDAVMTDPAGRNGLAGVAHAAVVALLGPGRGTALDIGCGTGVAAAPLRAAGWTPVGVDLALDQLRIGAGRLPVARGDAARLPVADASVAAAYSTFVASDLDDFAGTVREVYRVLAPGGCYVPVCLHPCFDGNHTRRDPDGTVVAHPGYRETTYAPPAHFTSTVRGAVGAWHRPLAAQLNTYLDTGFRLLKVVEDGTDPIPNQLALLLLKPAAGPDHPQGGPP